MIISPSRILKSLRLLLNFRMQIKGARCVIVLTTLILILCSSILAQSSLERLKDGNRARNAGNLSEAEAIYRSLLEDPALDEAAREALAQVLSWQGKIR